MKTWVLCDELMARPGSDQEIIVWICTDDKRWFILKSDGTLRQTSMVEYADHCWQPSGEAFCTNEL